MQQLSVAPSSLPLPLYDRVMDAGGIIAGEGNPNKRSTDDVLILDRCTSDVINTLLVACATRDAAFYLFRQLGRDISIPLTSIDPPS